MNEKMKIYRLEIKMKDHEPCCFHRQFLRLFSIPDYENGDIFIRPIS